MQQLRGGALMEWPVLCCALLLCAAMCARAEVVVVGADGLTVRVLGRVDAKGSFAPSLSISSSLSSPPSSPLLTELWQVRVPSVSPLPFLHRVVRLSSGYVDPYDVSRNRAQVVIAVTAGGEVLCIDAATRSLLWRSRASGEDAARGEADEAVDRGREGQGGDGEVGSARLSSSEVSVLVNPHPMRLNDSGVVVVGVRVRPSGHFSHFAFSGRSGQMRWCHDTNDFLSSSHSSTSADVMHEAHEVHTGEVEWRNYRSAFLSSLPHLWLSPADTSLQLVQVSPPQRQGQLGVKAAADARASSSRRAAASLSASLPSSSLLSVPSASARWAHDDAEHLPHPNALFAHTREGVELLSFYTGRPLAHLALQPGQLHADLNGDSVIDHVQLLNGVAAKGEGGAVGAEDAAMPLASSSWLSSFSPCTAMVSSGVPPSSHLFNVSLCSGGLKRALFRGIAALGARAMQKGRGQVVGVGGIPWTQSMQGRRHLRLSPQQGGTMAPPAGRHRAPRRRPPHPLASASAAADDGSPAELMTQREEDQLEGAGGGGGGGLGEEELLELPQGVGEEEVSEWVSSPLVLPAVQRSGADGPLSSAALVSYFLSSDGLLTALDGHGRKLFATRTTATLTATAPLNTAPADTDALHNRATQHHVLHYQVKRDQSQVGPHQRTSARLHTTSPFSIPAPPTHLRLCCLLFLHCAWMGG